MAMSQPFFAARSPCVEGGFDSRQHQRQDKNEETGGNRPPSGRAGVNQRQIEIFAGGSTSSLLAISGFMEEFLMFAPERTRF
jgi:hypothetical protein